MRYINIRSQAKWQKEIIRKDPDYKSTIIRFPRVKNLSDFGRS